jgi:hypothetical protein
MGRVADALKRLHASSWKSSGFPPAVERYILSGDENALSRLAPAKGTYTFWQRELTSALGSPHLWGDEERRTAKALAKAGDVKELFDRLDQLLAQETPEQDFLKVVAEATSLDEGQLSAAVIGLERLNSPGGRPTSAGRYVLSLSLERLRDAMNVARVHRWCALAELLVRHDISRALELADDFLGSVSLTSAEVAQILLQHGKEKFEPAVVRAFERRELHCQFFIADALHQYNAAKYDSLLQETAIKAVRDGYIPAAEWMIEHFRPEMKSDLTVFFAGGKERGHLTDTLLGQAVRKLGQDAEPMVLAALESKKSQHPHYLHSYLQYLIALNPSGQADRIERELRKGLALEEPDQVPQFIHLAARWDPAKLEPELTGLLQHPSRPVRQAAARALGKLGDASLGKARELLASKKADLRAAGVELLSSVATKAAIEELDQRLGQESNDDVRDPDAVGAGAGLDGAGPQDRPRRHCPTGAAMRG